MKTQKVKLSKIKINPNNPRIIRDEKFDKLVKSIKEFPEMLDIRPIVVNSDMIILGGNMRYRACEAAGLKEIPIIVADNLTPEQQREFLIKDNISGGEWDWNLLANEWDQNELTEWGLDVISIDDSNLDDYFEEASANSEKGKFQIVLNYTEGEYNEITDKLKNIGGSKEAIVYDLIMKE